MSPLADALLQLLQSVAVVLIAPAVMGWVNICRAWLQNRSAPSLWLPYYTLGKLFHKDAVIANTVSPLFRVTPYVLFGCMWLAAGIVPVLATNLPFAPAADIIALVGLFATARVFSALAAMDTGTSFGGLGARREMMIGFLAEPAMLMTLFTAAFISGSTQLPTIVETLAHREFAIYPSLAFAGVAFLMVLLAENARIPVDNPTTHLELTVADGVRQVIRFPTPQGGANPERLTVTVRAEDGSVRLSQEAGWEGNTGKRSFLAEFEIGRYTFEASSPEGWNASGSFEIGSLTPERATIEAPLHKSR